MSGLGCPSKAQMYLSCRVASLLAALTNASNSHALNLTNGIALNFEEEIALAWPGNFIAVTCTVSPSEVTIRSEFSTRWIGWFFFPSALLHPLLGL
jgi:hypothetical protein